MRTRLISAIILAPTAIISVMLGGWWLFAFYGTGMLIAAYEYYGMTRQAGYRPLWLPALVIIAALFVDALLKLNLLLPLLALAIAIPPLWEMAPHRIRMLLALDQKQPSDSSPQIHAGFLLNWALTTLGVLYLGVLGAHMFLLRNIGDANVPSEFNLMGLAIPLGAGAQLLGIALLATWLTDMFAYIAGRAWGRHPFYPDISPKKTREGAIGGIIAGTLGFTILGTIYGMSPALALLGGLGISLIATAGDLVESLIKRNIGVKDSGTLIAGHGGVLDRLDAMFFTLTFAYYYCTLVLGYR